jgi:hypothetical protein
MTVFVPRHFRIHNAIQFFESVSEADPTRYYFYIGKSFAFANAVPLIGTVKLTSTSNTIVGQGTYFDNPRQVQVGDRISVTGQYASGNTDPHIMRVHQILSGQTMIVTPRPVMTITAGANAYNRKLWSENSPPVPNNNIQNIYYDIWRNMMSLKRVQQSDVSHITTRYGWANNTFYYEYDDEDVDLYGERFYTYTSDNNVYKCIDNNRGANSTVMPTGTGTSLINTADGYRWKYMYTISAGEILKFRTADYIPVKTLTADDGSAQWTVQQNAINSGNGAIFHIKIYSNGHNYLHTTNTFTTVTNTTWMRLKPTASGIDGTYVGSGLFISEGAAAGQYRKIVKYWGANNTLVVNGAFSTTPNTSSRYIISPLVTIRGDSGGTSTSRAVAYVSNTFLGQVRKITMINYGRSYSQANVSITANASHGFGASARPIIPPLTGHGSDPVDELYGTSVMMNVRTTGSESNTFTTNNDFRIIGIVADPLLANGSPATASVIDQTTRVGVELVNGDFIEDEIITGTVSGAKARLVYFANTTSSRTDGVLKVIRVTTNGTGGGFRVGELVRGSESGLTANVVSVTAPALKPYTGFLIYTENREPVLRDPAQTEDYKITISF